MTVRTHRFACWPIALPLMLLCPVAAQAAKCDVRPRGVDFGAYNALQGSPREGVGTVTIRCDAVVAFTIELSAGQGTYAARTMTSPNGRLVYNLYEDVGRRTVWGDGRNGSGSVSANTSKAQFSIYGLIPARQNPPAGGYTDTIVVTVVY